MILENQSSTKVLSEPGEAKALRAIGPLFQRGRA